MNHQKNQIARFIIKAGFAGSLLLVPAFIYGVFGGCGATTDSSSSSSSSSGSSSSSDVSSLTQVPDVSTLVSTSSTSSSLESSDMAAAVVGTPPLLKDITSTNADTYFWDGLIATINSASSVTQAQANAFWEGEGACRMGQATGYAFQQIGQGGTSLCYMKNAPSAANGLTITKGTVTDNTKIFDQSTSSQVVKVTTSNVTGGGGGSGGGDQDIFIKVFGSSSTEGSTGYAADLWFCSAGSVVGYEKIRINTSTNAITTTSVHKENGTFVGVISGNITKSGSSYIFDSSKSRSAQAYFTDSSNNFTFLSDVTLGDGTLTVDNYQNGSFNSGTSMTNKVYITAGYTGSTFPTLRFNEAGFAVVNDFPGAADQTITGATEFQTSKYVDVTSGSLLSAAQSKSLTGGVYSGSTSTYTTLASAVSDYSCSTTTDVEVTMDFSASGPQAVASQCEPVFSNMDFCDSSSINTARNKVITLLSSNGCSTTNCVTGDDFACQRWADNNLGNSAGITTANAKCNSSGCCDATGSN